MIIFKIRHKVTGKYSKGGSYVPGNGLGSLWTDEGRSKSWDTLGKLRSHITSHLPKYAGDHSTDMSQWQVLEYEVIQRDCKDIIDVIKPEKILQLLKN